MKKKNNDLSSSADIFTSNYIFENIGTPFVIGLAVGYFAKKMLLISLFLCGGAIVLLFVSEYFGMAQISDANLQQAADKTPF
jgi:uncharacterized membrane protein (Fun14 family)